MGKIGPDRSGFVNPIPPILRYTIMISQPVSMELPGKVVFDLEMKHNRVLMSYFYVYPKWFNVLLLDVISEISI
jgi:hypothetical protein